MYVKRKIANIYKYEINNTMSTGYFDLIIQSQPNLIKIDFNSCSAEEGNIQRAFRC